MNRTLRIALGTLVASTLALSAAAPAQAIKKGQPLVGSEYFATQVPFSIFGIDEPATKKFNKVFRDIKRANFNAVRVIFAWGEQEPQGPVNGKHTYFWENFDRYVRIMARNGVRAQAVLGYSPFWARVSNDQCAAGIAAIEPSQRHLDSWQLAVRAFVKRYGKNGTFWRLNPDLKRLPINVYEIWNEPSIRPFWCPGADPRKYGEVLLRAANEINKLDRKATVVSGGVPEGSNFTVGSGSMSARQFFKKLFKRKPILKRKIDAVGIHPYEFLRSMKFFYNAIEGFRKSLRRAGVPDRIPMMITETGWPEGKKWGYPRKKRHRSYRHSISNLPRTNCNVIGVSYYSWLTYRSPTNPLSYLNLANLDTLKPLPVVRVIKRGIAIETGEGRKPKVEARMDCEGMPKPDRDRDGIPDERDPKPLIPKR